jgi:hypothetical protein
MTSIPVEYGIVTKLAMNAGLTLQNARKIGGNMCLHYRILRFRILPITRKIPGVSDNGMRALSRCILNFVRQRGHGLNFLSRGGINDEHIHNSITSGRPFATPDGQRSI